MPVNLYVTTVSLCYVFKVSLVLPDLILRTNTIHISIGSGSFYLGQGHIQGQWSIGQKINSKWPKWITKQSVQCNVKQFSKFFPHFLLN